MIPETIKNLLSREHSVQVNKVTSLSGGDINRAAKLSTNRGDLFLKWNHNAPADMFEKEEEGLDLLRQAGGNIKVPDTIAHQNPEGEMPGFLLMEFIHSGTGSSDDAFRFGAEMAGIHNQSNSHFGLDHNNYIGRLPQSNKQHKSWNTFFVEERIKPQVKTAIDAGKLPESILKNCERFYFELESIFPGNKPSLLHGDLWGGNYFFDTNGIGVLIDPAVYYGHPEMDLAFTKMFGGFPSEFYRGYESVNTLEPGFNGRIQIYNLYPLLVHVNLFGGGYASRARRFLENY